MIKFSLLLLLALVSQSAHAQMTDRRLERAEPAYLTAHKAGGSDKAVALTREMTERLKLNEGQYLKLLTVNRTKLARLGTINREYKKDETLRNAKGAELEAQYEQECSRILTPSQLSQLQQNTSRPAAEPAGAGNGLG